MLLIIFLVTLAFAGSTEGENILPSGTLIASVNGTVMFNTTLPPTEKPFFVITWTFDGVEIISHEPDKNTTGPEYEGRITLFISTGSLELRNLKQSDSGTYRIKIFPGSLGGEKVLLVIVPVSNVTVAPNSTDFEESSSSASLSCSASGTSLSFSWMNDTSMVTESDRVQFANGNATLIIAAVTRYDTGPYKCNVSNAISSATSDPTSINVNYGPENLKLTSNPSPGPHIQGTDVSLTCSVESKPPAQFTWFLNETKLPDSGSELPLKNIQINQTGNYNCQAFNPKTLKNQTAEPLSINVVERISNVVIKSDSADLIEFSSSGRLFCSSSGSSPSFSWMNGSSDVTESDRIHLTDGDSTLTVINVTRFDQGPYSCNVSNSFSSSISNPENFVVNYGPENTELKISPPQLSFVEGSTIYLTCAVVSVPDALFQWFLNETLLNDTGPDLTLMKVQVQQSGNYICKTFNNKTLRNQTSQPTYISVYASDPSNAGLSEGAIAGIVIAVLVGLGAAGAAVYIIKKKRKRKSPNINVSATRDAGHQGNGANGPEDLNYIEVKSTRNKRSDTIPIDKENTSSNYAVIKENRTPKMSSPPTYDAHMEHAMSQAAQPADDVAQLYAQVNKNRVG